MPYLKALKFNKRLGRLREEICDALQDFSPFVPFKKREKYPWRTVTFSRFQAGDCNFTKSNTRPWVLFTFFKLYKWYKIAQSIIYNIVNPLATNVAHHIESSQLICTANQLTGFYMTGNIGR